MAHVVVAALVGVCLLLCTSWKAEAAGGSYIDFGEYDSYRALAAGTARGVTFEDGSARLARGRTTGTLTSPVYASAHKNTFIPSWNASTPSKTYLRVEMRVRSSGNWTRWWQMGVWARDTGTVKRHSVNGQKAGSWRVKTDTLQSTGSVFADAYQYRLALVSGEAGRTPRVGAVYMTASNSYRHGESTGETSSAKRGSRTARAASPTSRTPKAGPYQDAPRPTGAGRRRLQASGNRCQVYSLKPVAFFENRLNSDGRRQALVYGFRPGEQACRFGVLQAAL